MKMMPPDVISHENQLQHLSEPSIFMLDVFRTADHAGQIFIPHRPRNCPAPGLGVYTPDRFSYHTGHEVNPATGISRNLAGKEGFYCRCGMRIRPASPTFVARTECHITCSGLRLSGGKVIL